MKNKVTQTSRESNKTNIEEGKEVTQLKKVLNCIKKHGGLSTINKISRELNIYPSTVAARLSKLYQLNKAKKTGDTILDSVTKRSNEVISLVDAA
ncbi:MAG: winged helix-turn-helix domain-containing protein [Flavobacteriaceae bacterium]|nr:winged helix-turn-helix domain-containing protein [Flavobacteriaceae bacterium]